MPNIKHAKRCVTKDGSPTTQVKVTFVGPVPEVVHSRLFGTYPTHPWVPQPMWCYKCQKFGHHQSNCYRQDTCGVCSGKHSTEDCTTKHKTGHLTTEKCPNCQGTHHAWNKPCTCPTCHPKLPPQGQPHKYHGVSRCNHKLLNPETKRQQN